MDASQGALSEGTSSAPHTAIRPDQDASKTSQVDQNSSKMPSAVQSKRKQASLDSEEETADDTISHTGSDSDEDIGLLFSTACTYLKLDRSAKLVINASSPSESSCQVPTARRLMRTGGSQSKSWETPIKASGPTTMVVLDPVLDGPAEFPTRVAAASTSSMMGKLLGTTPPAKKAKTLSAIEPSAISNRPDEASLQKCATPAMTGTGDVTIQDGKTKEVLDQSGKTMENTQLATLVDNNLITEVASANEDAERMVVDGVSVTTEAPSDLPTITNQKDLKTFAEGSGEANGDDELPNGEAEDDKTEGEGVPSLSSDEKREADASITENSSKKPQKEKDTEKWNSARSIKSLGRIKKKVEGAVQKYVEEAVAIFDPHTLPPAPKNLDRTPGAALCLPSSACPVTRFTFQQITTETVNGWERYFRAHFTDEVKLMITKMKALQKELESGQQPADEINKLTARNEEVDVMLKRAVSISEQITRSRMKISKMKVAGDENLQELKSYEAKYVAHIQVLEAQLAETKSNLELVRSSQTKYNDFLVQEQTVSEDINTSSVRLNQAITKGSALSKKLHERLQDSDDDNLPAVVQALRSLVKHYPVKE
ncbi:hypothetical protein EJB05_34579 [Eragrostis curvula]|uniref:Uncharacterized protein n=1 Tax=Eragrostis curvula TaxID=38414 RepID=A0A5J9SGD7_9POAL|nr:hypothetical protein EJB05_57434 [Eragrostis curvula]TVU18477.1 hypothetical protein EJB05_34579 [Eragrostis curvula]